jgi:hypothetical protein
MIVQKHYVMKDKVRPFITVGGGERGIKVQELRASLILVTKSNRNPAGCIRV